MKKNFLKLTFLLSLLTFIILPSPFNEENPWPLNIVNEEF